MRLILFDIDGTLITSGYAGREVLSRALRHVFGIAFPVDGYSLAGKTDRGAIIELARAAGMSPDSIETRLPAIYEQMAVEGRRLFAGAYQPLPGVPQLLEALHAHAGITLGLLTGNCEATAPLKLSAAGIRPDYFRIGAYGSDDEDRNQLISIAKLRAAQVTSQAFNGRDTIVVGDTPADILCARSAGAGIVAVASGFYSSAALEQLQPDHLLPDLSDVEHVIALLMDDA
jgi:phosphoglycolate phosphatase-like HAD superfamily hydrolase